ncbi:MAG: FG-GAP repeat protein [Polyangia bacterium]
MILALATSSTKVEAAATYWAQQSTVQPSGVMLQTAFRTQLALSGSTVVVGDYAVGTSYIHTRSGTRWFEEARLTPSDTVGSSFGITVALSGDTAVFGATSADLKGQDSGAAYVFQRSGTTWTQAQKLTTNFPSSNASFGTSAAASPDTILIGVPSTLPQAYYFSQVATLTITLSDGATFSDARGDGWTCQVDGATATCSRTKVTAGLTNLTLTLLMPPAAGSFRLQAQLRSATYDTNAADNDSTAVLTLAGGGTCTEATCPPGTPGAPGDPAMATGCTTATGASGATGAAPWTAIFVAGACLLLLRRRVR